MRKESERTVRKGASETIGAEIGTTVGTEPWVGEEVPSVEEQAEVVREAAMDDVGEKAGGVGGEIVEVVGWDWGSGRVSAARD
jgi:hypothetical protein